MNLFNSPRALSCGQPPQGLCCEWPHFDTALLSRRRSRLTRYKQERGARQFIWHLVCLISAWSHATFYEEKRTITVSFENTNNRTLRLARYLLPEVALLLALVITPAKSHAQITGNIEANIPFQFHVGDAKLPAGKYLIRMLDDSDLTVMEISSVDGSISALFDV